MYDSKQEGEGGESVCERKKVEVKYGERKLETDKAEIGREGTMFVTKKGMLSLILPCPWILTNARTRTSRCSVIQKGIHVPKQ